MTLADEIRAALAKMTPGDWGCGYGTGDGTGDGGGEYAYISSPSRFGDVLDDIGGLLDDDLAGIVTLRNKVPALLEELAAEKARADKAEAEVARLREALDEVCKLSNSDWLEARMYPHDLLDQISDIAVRAYYNWPRKSA